MVVTVLVALWILVFPILLLGILYKDHNHQNQNISLELKVFVLVLKPILEMLVQTQKLIGEWILMTFLVG